MFDTIINIIIQQMMSLGYAGIYSIMFLAGSILPIPWDVVLLLIGSLGYDPLIASLLAGLGASLGGAVGYYLGQLIGRPLLIRYGGYILVNENDLIKAEKWISNWGAPATLILRSIQYMPYKTYNFVAGISKMDFKIYMVLTIVGSIIRCTYLIYLGKMTNFTPETMIIIMTIFLIASLLTLISRFYKKEPKNSLL